MIIICHPPTSPCFYSGHCWPWMYTVRSKQPIFIIVLRLVRLYPSGRCGESRFGAIPKCDSSIFVWEGFWRDVRFVSHPRRRRLKGENSLCNNREDTKERRQAVQSLVYVRQQFEAALLNSMEWNKEGESVANTTLVLVKAWKTRTIQRLWKRMTDEFNLKNNEELSQKILNVDASSEDDTRYPWMLLHLTLPDISLIRELRIPYHFDLGLYSGSKWSYFAMLLYTHWNMKYKQKLMYSEWHWSFLGWLWVTPKMTHFYKKSRFSKNSS